MAAEQLAVSVLGTGPFGRALASRLADGGAKVWLGSRDPSDLRCEVLTALPPVPTPPQVPGSVTVVSTREALRQGRVVVLAVPHQFQRSLPLQELRPGTVVVDCANRYVSDLGSCSYSSSRYSQVSEGRLTSAEELARHLPPGVQLVKAFNTLEEGDLVGDRQVLKDLGSCSDNQPNATHYSSSCSCSRVNKKHQII